MYSEKVVTREPQRNYQIREYVKSIPETYSEIFYLIKEKLQKYDENIKNFPSYTTDGIITHCIYLDQNEYIQIVDDKEIKIYHHIEYEKGIKFCKIVKFLNFEDLFIYIELMVKSSVLNQK